MIVVVEQTSYHKPDYAPYRQTFFSGFFFYRFKPQQGPASYFLRTVLLLIHLLRYWASGK